MLTNATFLLLFFFFYEMRSFECFSPLRLNLSHEMVLFQYTALSFHGSNLGDDGPTEDFVYQT